MKSGPRKPSAILVRSPNWIGDQVLAYPFFHALRELFPDAFIAAVCPAWNESLQFRDLVDQVELIPQPTAPGFWPKAVALESAANRLAKKKWDLGFALPPSFSAAWFLYRAGVRYRVGYRADARSFLLTSALRRPSEEVMHRADEYIALLGEWSTHLKGKAFWGSPSHFEEEGEENAIPQQRPLFPAERSWPTARPLSPPEFPYWVLAPGAVADSRRWDLRSFIELAQIIIQQTGLRALIVGGQAEAAWARTLLDAAPGKILDFTAQGSPADYWRLFRGARFFVGNDSGLAHLAALSGCSVQVIWGAGDARRTCPIGPGRVTLSVNPVGCWPCEKNRCSQPPGLYRQCLTGQSPEQVWEEVSGALGKP